ncbi:large conductance mechanosensitive channel protein MscL [Hymenobacter cellulosivorans]|uniref:Large-conductance mechanosensitive channel n=1 Tax=Hymenobacter cellulosivorans TaxID=2932249 RepID=A0ABY4F9Y7_9BACT|nr:large conductance mechanosensitive channel protein MscL [Hymenobacter cellulosivorans]UOQ53482.1 large conductance mechanosensitive channel protein MscL [Hymenobacter cellulosivorans]
MSVVSEFKEFISKGNVLDLAVGVIIGAAFGKIVTSLTDDIIMPIIGLAIGGIDLKEWYLPLDGNSYANFEAAKAAKAATVNYGLFLNAIIYFFIIAFCVFLIVKVANRFKKPPVVVAVADPTPTKDQALLMEIRDALRNR